MGMLERVDMHYELSAVTTKLRHRSRALLCSCRPLHFHHASHPADRAFSRLSNSLLEKRVHVRSAVATVDNLSWSTSLQCRGINCTQGFPAPSALDFVPPSHS